MPSFVVVSELNAHELTNAVDQANRELAQRFDFKDTGAVYELQELTVTMRAQVDFQLKQMLEILKLRLAKRGIDLAYLDVQEPQITLATAQQVLRNIIASQEKRVTIDLIQKRVSEHFNLREQDLKMRSNTRAIAIPRQVDMYIVKQLTTASLPEIGRQFGGKHHTTVLHSINRIEELRRSDKELNRTITRLMDALQ
jgi:chromosomal replication initiation ATPase DnaA